MILAGPLTSLSPEGHLCSQSEKPSSGRGHESGTCPEVPARFLPMRDAETAHIKSPACKAPHMGWTHRNSMFPETLPANMTGGDGQPASPAAAAAHLACPSRSCRPTPTGGGLGHPTPDRREGRGGRLLTDNHSLIGCCFNK